MSYTQYAALAGGAYAAGRAYKRWRGSKPSMPKRKPRSFKSKVKSIINQVGETKFVDTEINNATAVAGTSTVTFLTGIAQGDDDTQREGNRIKIQSIQIRGLVSADKDAVNGAPCRMILFRNHTRNNGSNPAVTSILEADAYFAYRNKDNNGDFTTIWDKTFIIPPSGAAISEAEFNTMDIRYYKRFKKPLNAYYDLTSNVIGAAEKGHLFLMLMTENGATFIPLYKLNIRVAFKDL